MENDTLNFHISQHNTEVANILSQVLTQNLHEPSQKGTNYSIVPSKNSLKQLDSTIVDKFKSSLQKNFDELAPERLSIIQDVSKSSINEIIEKLCQFIIDFPPEEAIIKPGTLPQASLFTIKELEDLNLTILLKNILENDGKLSTQI